MHNYTSRDGMFTVRKPSWHGLETAVLPDHPTREVAKSIAHPWEPITEPVYRKVVKVTETGHPYGTYEQVEGFNAVVRSDINTTIGVVSDTYEPVTNAEMYDIAEAIEGNEPDSVKYETGGSLKGGRKVWLLLRLAEPLVVPGDPNGATIPYYALQNALDGSGCFRGQCTMTRIVCDNTALAADLDARARGMEFAFRHTKNVRERIEEAKQALANWRAAITVWHEFSLGMIDLRLDQHQQMLFVEQFIPMPATHTVSDRVASNVIEARERLTSILRGPTCEGIDLTAYGLVQASIEYVQHERRARNAESQFKRAYLDHARVTEDAVRIAREVALHG